MLVKNMRIFFLQCMNEIRKELFLIWSYRVQWIFEIVALILFFFFLSRINLSFSQFSFEYSLINYATWFYAILIIGDIGGKLANEMRSGTFEILCLAVIPIFWILLARIFASIIRATALFFLLVVPLALIFSVPVSFQHLQLFFKVFCGLLPSLLGLSFLLGSITLIIKEVGSIINIVNNSILFLSGGFVPFSAFPKWVVFIANHLPTTQAMTIFRNHLMFQNDLLFNKEMTILIVHSFLYLIIGVLLFLSCEKKVRLAGTLGHY